MRASVVFPDPGGPQKMHDATSPRRISSPSALPGPSRRSWPMNSSSVRGRILAASGSGEGWKRVGSDMIQDQLGGDKDTGARKEPPPQPPPPLALKLGHQARRCHPDPHARPDG